MNSIRKFVVPSLPINKFLSKADAETNFVKKTDFFIDNISSQTDGATTVFTLTHSYVAGSVNLRGQVFPNAYINGIDFTESADKQITLDASVDTPPTNTRLQAIYIKS